MTAGFSFDDEPPVNCSRKDIASAILLPSGNRKIIDVNLEGADCIILVAYAENKLCRTSIPSILSDFPFIKDLRLEMGGRGSYPTL